MQTYEKNPAFGQKWLSLQTEGEQKLMTAEELETIFAEHGIRPTANRLIIARALNAANCPLSLRDLEERLITIDKSSIFRTLSLFRDQHMVHDIEDGTGRVKYELCLSHNEGEDDDEHVHFYCERCHRTFCLYDVHIPRASLPAGYRQTSVNYVARGVCPECSLPQSPSHRRGPRSR